MTTLPDREASKAMQTFDKFLLQGHHTLPDIKLKGEGSRIVRAHNKELHIDGRNSQHAVAPR